MEVQVAEPAPRVPFVNDFSFNRYHGSGNVDNEITRSASNGVNNNTTDSVLAHDDSLNQLLQSNHPNPSRSLPNSPDRKPWNSGNLPCCCNNSYPYNLPIVPLYMLGALKSVSERARSEIFKKRNPLVNNKLSPTNRQTSGSPVCKSGNIEGHTDSSHGQQLWLAIYY